MAKLTFIGERFAGRQYELVLERTTVGRGDHNTLTIHDDSVSDAHCIIFTNNEDAIVRDLGSSNGTFVDGNRLQDEQRPVKPGQIVRFGAVAVRFEMEESQPGETATDVTAIHSHARLSDQRKETRSLESIFANADTKTGSAPTEDTLILPRPAEEISPVKTTISGQPRLEERSLYPWRTALLLATIIGTVILLWLVFGSGGRR